MSFMNGRLFMGSSSCGNKSIIRILIGDPSYFKSKKDFQRTIASPSASHLSRSPSMYVSLLITQSLWDAINVNSKKFLRSSIENPDEQYYDFTTPQDRTFILPPSHPNYLHIGSHMTDSRLTSIIRADIYDDPKTHDQINVDWTEFVYYTLYGDDNAQADPNDFPIFKFYGRIPDEESMAISVFGIPQGQCENGEKIYERIILRPFDFVNKNHQDDNDTTADNQNN